MSISIKNLNYVYDPESPFSVAALENVDLNVFDNEATALSYMEKAKQTLKMKSIRMTRLMGEPTGNVVLVFENVTKKEKGQLQKIAQKHKKQLQDCPIE